MEIRRIGSTPSRRANAEWFTGNVWQNPIFQAEAPGRVHSVLVRFDPGARTNWHTHPLGQTLHVLSGSGLVQCEGEPVRQINAGDSVWIAAGERHWHGARPDIAMTHIAIQEMLEGKAADWQDPVSDADYEAWVAGS